MDFSAKALVAAATLALAGCAAPPPYDHTTQHPPGTYPSTHPSSYPAAYSGYGYVDSVEVIPATGTTGPGIGAVGGAVVGGVLGNQIGSGSGRAAATVGGAVAGAAAGHHIEKSMRGSRETVYRFRVRMDDGSYQTFTQEAHHDIRVGDRVRVENGRVFRT